MRTGQVARVPALLLALGLVATATSSKTHDFNYNFRLDRDHDGPITSCSDFEMRFGQDGDDIVTVRRDKTLVVKEPGSGPLRVRPGEHGGVFVQPSTDGGYSALVCMAAGARSSQDADAILDQVQIENTDGTLSVSCPESDWAAYIVLSVPPDVVLDLGTTNGPLNLWDVSGNFTLRTTNGPISIAGTNGVVDAQTQNGPIKFTGHEGDVRLEAQNGPVKVTLDDATWTGRGLDASTQNGPAKLEAPDSLNAGVEIHGSWHSPVKVNGAKSWRGVGPGGPRYYRLGSGPVLVRLSTVNGPLEIKGPEPAGPVEI